MHTIINRRWGIIAELGARRRGASVQYLQAALRTSRSTLYRDLKFLRQRGFIDSERVNGEARYTLMARPLPTMRPTALQGAALYLARQALSALDGTRVVRELDALLARLWPDAAEQGPPPSQTDAIPTMQSTPPHPRRPELVQIIDDAILSGHRIGFRYQSVDQDAPSPRRVDPVGFRCYHDHVYLVAWDCDREDWRTFKPVRIEAVERLDERADPHPDYDEAALFGHAAKIWAGDEVVEVAVRIAAPVARYVHEWPLTGEQEATPEADGTVLVRARVAGLVEAKRWVLSWGRNAEVLAPPSLRRALAEELTCAHALYDLEADPPSSSQHR